MPNPPTRWSDRTLERTRRVLARRGLPATEADALRVLDQLAPGLSALIESVGQDRVLSRGSEGT